MFAILTSISVLASLPLLGGGEAQSNEIEFNRDVRPILSNRCFVCHGPDEDTRQVGLRLDTEDGMLARLESNRGFSVLPGKLTQSQLLDRITAGKDSNIQRMPPDDPLPEREISILRQWIQQGAKWQSHWSLIPPRQAKIPRSANSKLVHNPIDHFVQSRLVQEGLLSSPIGDRVTLLRRLSFDLLGLPPNASDVRRFTNDKRVDAYEQLVDRFLASPYFGERIATYWLDLVRYADTVGYHGDQDHNAAPYRDYVIRAFNQNMPFDQFTVEQLAGDLLDRPTTWKKVASGYNRLLQTTHEGGAQDAEYLVKYAADRVRTTVLVWMGATMGCCECHDHKFDSYTIKDFYRFAAFFADLEEQGVYRVANSLLPTQRPPEMPVLTDDDMAIVRSMLTTQINHDPAHTVMNTGTSISGRPSMGSWVTYGLGLGSQSLPGFVVLSSRKGRNPQPIASRQWHSGFLPGQYQGVEFSSSGVPVHYIRNPQGVPHSQQRQIVSAIKQLNEQRFHTVQNKEILSRIAQYELAFRMQTSIPDLMDLSDEPQHILHMYGTRGADGSFAGSCLLARRLAERGVRFIQLYHRGWDHHGDFVRYMNTCCGAVDQATAALVTDLMQRGMLDETLVVWGGEFGRTPMFQGKRAIAGRDHHIQGFSMWLAGGGIRGGVTHGETDELGYAAAKDIVHVHDLHATMLHLLGIDHQRLTIRYQGRDFRLTDVHGKVVGGIVS